MRHLYITLLTYTCFWASTLSLRDVTSLNLLLLANRETHLCVPLFVMLCFSNVTLLALNDASMCSSTSLNEHVSVYSCF